ncbi:MAG TPA: outer membrane beta-barrel protein [Gemmatimonadaceae bacterium]|nr:outer membrane beta-barrel protein [Gemmatimonadaceae bacterium]
MMKRAMLGAALVAVALIPSVSHAQRRSSAAQPLKFSLGAGVAMPMSDWGDVVGTGFSVNGTGTKKLAGSPVFLRGEAAVTIFGSKDIQGSGIKGSGNQFAGMFDVGYSFVTSTTVKPYVLGGLGLHHSTMKVDMTSAGGNKASDSNDDLGVNVGGGMRFRMGSRNAALEARYISAGDVKHLPIGLSIEF